MPAVHFFSEDIPFKLPNIRNTTHWIKAVITREGKELGSLNFIFCSDSYLLEVNQQYLNHNTLTDIITFDGREEADQIAGDIFISVDRVKENASKFGVTFLDELHRVIIHGVLHLIGYNDKKPKQKELMREKESECLSLRRVPRGTSKDKKKEETKKRST